MATPTFPTNIMELLRDMRVKIAQQDAAALQQTVAELDQAASALVVMQTLAPFLFRNGEQQQQEEFTSQEALTLLGFLVQSKPSSYLKPASKAIRDEAIRLTTSADPMFVSTELLNAMIGQVASTDVQAASNATDAVVACCRKLGLVVAEPALVAMAQQWQQALQRMTTDKSNASIIAIRCASAVIDLVAIDEQMMKLGVERKVLKLLLDMLMDDQDPLLQMSVLDLMEKMAQTRPMHHALAMWLFSSDVLKSLLQLAGGTEEDPDPILGGPALRVVAALCKLSQVDTRVFEAESTLLTGFHRALHNFQGSGELDRLAVMDAISSFAGASPDALALVLNDPVTREGWLSLNVSQSKLKAAILVSVARVIDPPPEHLHDGTSRHSSADLLKLYSFVGRANNQESTAMLLNFARSPLPEIRLGAYALLESVVKLPSGGQVLLSTDKFIDFLLSREGENTKEGREGRFAIVEAINQSPVKGLLSADIVRKIEKHVVEGPHYVKSIPWELATES
eukprot:scaffold6091_cov164-Amphora_coffeaeformis.AAC.16